MRNHEFIRRLTWKRVLLHIVLKDEPPSTELCEDLGKKMEIVYRLTENGKHDIAGRYHLYWWDIRVRQEEEFRRLLRKYQDEHPDLNIYAKYPSSAATIAKFAISIGGTAAVTFSAEKILLWLLG